MPPSTAAKMAAATGRSINMRPRRKSTDKGNLSLSSPSVRVALLIFMRSQLLSALAFTIGMSSPRLVHAAESLPATDQRVARFKDLNTPREFPAIHSRSEWESRAKEIREQILVSCGLWPIPEKPSLNARIFGKIERDGYSVEKAYFQTYPGFYLAGNLYRPLVTGSGPFPEIVNPHGHWPNGRMADTKEGSIVARCINFAKQGMIAFSY